MPSFESVFDGVVDKDEVHPNRCSDSSQDEDFRLRDSTPPLLVCFIYFSAIKFIFLSIFFISVTSLGFKKGSKD